VFILGHRCLYEWACSNRLFDLCDDPAPDAGEQRAILTAMFNGSQRTATVSVVGSRFDDVSVAPQSVVGGDSARGTITLSSAPADRDASVAMRSSSWPR
jgi:hypothetical protein